MDLILDTVFFSPLKRLYVFILKKSIGKFLKNPLHIEQLEVQISAGVIELHDVELNVEVLFVAVATLIFSTSFFITRCENLIFRCSTSFVLICRSNLFGEQLAWFEFEFLGKTF
jgi:hypothetical protein